MTEETASRLRLIRRVPLAETYAFYEIQANCELKDAQKTIASIEGIALICQSIREPEMTPEQKEDASQPLQYGIVGETVRFAVPFPMKDAFKQKIKDATGNWPKWDQQNKTWNIPKKDFTPELLKKLKTPQEGQGVLQ